MFEQWFEGNLPTVLLVALLLLAISIQTIRLWWEKTRAARRVRRYAEWGKDAEDRARQLLSQHGYIIAAAQQSASYDLLVDGHTVTVYVRADFLVNKGRRTFVAEVKAGEQSARLNRATRRQLLEYAISFDVDGVLLVDMHAERVLEVQFSRAPRVRALRRP